jgi:EAL domain-containing protein (putative c-di-GMP-specific phosphodiesterase class I)
MKVIAEGVEKKDHVEILKAVNCEKAQGYYFSRPVPIESIIEMYFC